VTLLDNQQLKDWWGTDALDFGRLDELTVKYKDKLIVTVTNKPFGDSYVLYICDADKEPLAKDYLTKYHKKMDNKGIRAYGAAVSLGSDLEAERMEGFQGGAL
jgi:hypothetical protein